MDDLHFFRASGTGRDGDQRSAGISIDGLDLEDMRETAARLETCIQFELPAIVRLSAHWYAAGLPEIRCLL